MKNKRLLVLELIPSAFVKYTTDYSYLTVPPVHGSMSHFNLLLTGELFNKPDQIFRFGFAVAPGLKQQTAGR